MNKILLFLLPLIFLPLGGNAQKMEHLVEFLTIYPNKKAVKRDSTVYPAKVIFTPVVSYAPETNLGFGVGMKSLFKMNGSGPETRTSNIPLTVQYTIENKYLFFSGFEVFFPQERYMLTGNVRIQSFPSLYFGIGPDTPKSNEEAFGYSQILLQPIFLKNLFIPYFFLGSGIRYNRISNLEIKKEGLLASTQQSGANGSTSLGVELAMMYDSRDNLLNASEGIFMQLTHGFYSNSIGSTQSFELTKFDLRFYTEVFDNPSSIFAFQIMTHSSHGDTPLLELGRLGGNLSMRGYFEGRFTDRHLYVTQVEWRQKLTHRWGVVAFAGLGNVAPSISEFRFEDTRPTVGFGFRFLVDEEEDLNLRLDFGLGQEKFNYYFKIAESF